MCVFVSEETELGSICAGEPLPDNAPSNKRQDAIVAAFIIVIIIVINHLLVSKDFSQL